MRSLGPALLPCLAAMLFASPVSAQVETTPIPAALKPDFSSMRFLAGTWSCSTKSSRRPLAYVTTSVYALDGSGYWLEETTTVKPPAWEPSPLRTYDKITYDADTKRWIDVSYGDQGAYGFTTSQGWNGDTIAWRDRAFVSGASIQSTTDTTMTKISPTKYETAMSFVEAGSGRTVTVKGICTKR